jgi:hypothetical protein
LLHKLQDNSSYSLHYNRLSRVVHHAAVAFVVCLQAYQRQLLLEKIMEEHLYCLDHHAAVAFVVCLQAYQRQLLLEKIMEENDKTEQLLNQRKFIQAQRKAANMTASLHRNKVNQLMESMKTSHNMEKLAPNGTIDLAVLSSQLKH